MNLVETTKFVERLQDIAGENDGSPAKSIELLQNINKLINGIEKVAFDKGYEAGLKKLNFK